jgi:hypothetical protein
MARRKAGAPVGGGHAALDEDNHHQQRAKDNSKGPAGPPAFRIGTVEPGALCSGSGVDDLALCPRRMRIDAILWLPTRSVRVCRRARRRRRRRSSSKRGGANDPDPGGAAPDGPLVPWRLHRRRAVRR